MPTALGFGPIKDDDELLDRLGARESDAIDGLEGLFASWTASIDDDEQAQARHVGPLGLRRADDGEDPVVAAVQRTKVLRVPRTRAVAVVGALALTLSGGGVAAALSQAPSDLVSRVIQKATQPIAGSMPGLAAQQAPTSPSDTSTIAAAWQMVEKAREAVDKGEVQKAIGMMEVIRSLAPKDPSGEQITAQVDQLEKSITATAPAVVADAPAKKAETTTDEVRPAEVALGGPSPSVPEPAAPATATLSSEKPTTMPSTDPSRSTPPSTATEPTPPATTAPGPSIGNVGGEQNPGTATSSPSDTDAPSSSEGSKTSRPAPSEPTSEPVEKPSDAAPSATTVTEAGSGAGPTTSEAPSRTTTGESSSAPTEQRSDASSAATAG